MNVLVTTDTGISKEVKGLNVLKQEVMKTKTKISVKINEKDQGFQESVMEDIALMKLEGEEVTSFIVTVEGAKAIGRIVNRSITAFSKLGIEVSELDWDADSGVTMFTGRLTTMDLPFLIEVVLRLTQRATRAISYTHHPLTLFDLKQTIGLIYDLKQGQDGAQDMLGWFDVRELIVLEEVKAEKAETKAKAKAETKANANELKKMNSKPKPKDKPKASTKAKTKPKAKGEEKNVPKTAKLNLI